MREGRVEGGKLGSTCVPAPRFDATHHFHVAIAINIRDGGQADPVSVESQLRAVVDVVRLGWCEHVQSAAVIALHNQMLAAGLRALGAVGQRETRCGFARCGVQHLEARGQGVAREARGSCVPTGGVRGQLVGEDGRLIKVGIFLMVRHLRGAAGVRREPMPTTTAVTTAAKVTTGVGGTTAADLLQRSPWLAVVNPPPPTYE